MHKRPRADNSAVAAVSNVSQHDAVQPLKKVLIRRKTRQDIGRFGVLIPVLSLLVLLAGLLLLRSSRFSASDVVIDPVSEEVKVAAFMDWFQTAGGTVSDKISIEMFPEMGRGVVALQAVQENDELLFVPQNVIICHETITKEWSLQPKLKTKLAKLESDQEELLTAFLLLEQAKGQASLWAPYLQLLPTFSSRNVVSSPLLFVSDKDVDALQDERMVKAARSERQRVEKAHGRFKRLFRSFVDKESIKLSRYVWVRFLVNSRAFSIRGQRVLVPFGDIFNGEPDNEPRQHDNGQRFLQFHDLQPEGMTVRADRGTPIGGQVLEDYGDNSNYVYFLHHGFLMDDRGFDCAIFHLPRLAEAYAQVEDEEQTEVLSSKLRILSRIKVDDGPQACISRTGKLEDSGLVRVYTALYNMDAERAAVCVNAQSFDECFPPELMPDFDTEPGRQEILLLLNSVRQQQERYPITLEEDLAILDGLIDGVASSSYKHAVTFRLSRKQILHDTQTALEQQLKYLDEEVKAEVSENLDSGKVELEEVASGGNKLERFQQWIVRHHFPVNHLTLRYVSEAVGYGTFAAKPLTTGDVYLEVPLKVVMDVRSAVKSRWVSQTMQELQKYHARIPKEEMLLLLHLLEEKFGPDHLQSRWKPYLDMLPDLNDQKGTLGSPLFYDENGEQLKMLEGTDLLALVINYRQRVGQSYAVLSDHLKRSGHAATLLWLIESRFRWANAILDSRSIWWDGQQHLVPLLDMVNCQELHSGQKPHHTNLESSGRHAVTKTSWDFETGQEVVENYAQPNYIYLLYHGFMLDANSHDCAHFHLELPLAARQRKFVAFLRSLEIYSWTPDVCVSPTDNQSVEKFSRIALLISDPQDVRNAAGSSPSALPQAIASALKLVEDRLGRLQSISADTVTTNNFRTQSIIKFRQQQLQLLVALRSKLFSIVH